MSLPDNMPAGGPPRVIGISGYAQTGKDTIAKILHDLYGYERVSFADQLRGFIYRQDLWMPPKDETPDNAAAADYKWYGKRINEVIDTFGWDAAKVRFPYIRTLQIKTGTEAGRTMKDSLWVDAALENAPQGKLLVFPDTRFTNEKNAILDRGGVVWRVHRTGVGPVSNHPSETEQDTWALPTQIMNDGTVEELAQKIILLMGARA